MATFSLLFLQSFTPLSPSLLIAIKIVNKKAGKPTIMQMGVIISIPKISPKSIYTIPEKQE